MENFTKKKRFDGFYLWALALLIFGVATMSSKATAQTQSKPNSISVKVTQATVLNALKEINRVSGNSVIFKTEEVEKAASGKTVTFDLKNVSVQEAVEQAIRTVSLGCTIRGGYVIVTPGAKKTHTVRGRVTDASGAAMAGVSITVKGSSQGVVSDANGNFELNRITEGSVLQFSFIGMQQKTVTVSGSAPLSITMNEEVAKVDEVVVVGYGTVRQKDFTGSVSSIKTNELKDIPYVSVDNALAGKAAGVQVIKADGAPGGAVRIRVRGGASLLGTNDPLYIIDGIPTMVTNNYQSTNKDVVNPLEAANYGDDFNNSLSGAFARGLNNLSGLNIADIESIDILKDASATAIYGSKAANGVVIITTKRGRKEQKPQLSVNYYFGVNVPIKEDVLNASQYKQALVKSSQQLIDDIIRVRGEGAAQLKTGNGKIASAIVADPDGYLGTANTDWLDLVTRTGFTHNADLSLTGGSATSRYYTSLSYTKQEGTLINTDFERISGKLSLDSDINRWLRMSTNINYGFTKNNITDGIYGQALTAPPTYPVYNEDGSWCTLGSLASDYMGFQNPMALAECTNQGKDYLLSGSIALDVQLMKDLKFKSAVSVNYDSYNQLNYTPSFVEVGGFYGREDSEGGQGTQAHSNTINSFFENTLTWDKEFNPNNRLNVLVGTSWESNRIDFFSASGKNYPDDYILNGLSSAGTATKIEGMNPQSKTSLLSFYARANYVFRDRYLATFTGRADASSKFGSNNRWGYFPSGALAWRISQESFLRDVQWVDEIKVRASIGKTGTQSIGDNMWRTLYKAANYAGKNVLIPTQMGNENIKWESTTQRDLGLDFSLFHGRLSGTFGLYRKVTDGALLNITPAPSTGNTTVVFNIAKIRNNGVEFELRGDILRTRNFRWNGDVNISRNTSKVLDIQGDTFSDPNDRENLNLGTSVVKEGESLGLFYGRVVKGEIASEEALAAYKEAFPFYKYFDPYITVGDYEYEIEDGLWKEDVIGNSTPDFFGGSTQTFSYKNWQLQALFTFSYGGQLIYQKDVSDSNMSSLPNRGVSVLDSDRPIQRYGSTMFLTNKNVYDASYLKLKSLTLSYQFSSEWCKRIGINALSLYGTATNLFTVTNYPGPDPEVSDAPGSVIGGGRDVSTYPTVKSYTFGVRVNF